MTIPRFRLASLFVMTTALAAAARAAEAQAILPDSAIQQILRTRVDSGRAVGIVVGVLENGQRRYVSYGSAGPGRAPLDAHTLFEIGSISKTFTGLLLAEAVVRGEVKLDTPVQELLPPGTVVPSKDGKPITLVELSTHRSGLPRLPTNLQPANVADPYVDYDAKKLYAFLASYQLPRAPGDSAEYSNLGAGLLGFALARQAGASSWGALVAQRITGPLGMRETVVDVPPALATRFSAGHNAKMDSVPYWQLDALAGAGALRSTAADMLTYLAAEMDTTHGPLARAIALGRTPRADFGPGRIALGWIVIGPAATQIWTHDGGTGGFSSFVAFDPARKVGVVVLSNASVPVQDIGLHLMIPAAPLAMPMLPPATTVTLAPEALDRLAGEYLLSPMMALRIFRQGDALFGQATGQGAFPLTATSPTRFVFVPAGIELTFTLGDSGPAPELTFKQGGVTLTAKRRP